MEPEDIEFVVCERGHVTAPWADVDTTCGKIIEPENARQVPVGYVEQGSYAFTRVCRAGVEMGSTRSTHSCQRPVRPMTEAEQTAYKLGGAAAVKAMVNV